MASDILSGGDRPPASIVAPSDPHLDATPGIDYRQLLERIPAVSYIAATGDTAPWLYVSPQIEPLLGYTPAEWEADPTLWYQRIHPSDRGFVLEEEATAKHTGHLLLSEYRLLHRDGHPVWVHDEATLVYGPDGVPVWQGFMIDISKRKEAEEALEDSEARYRGVFDHVPVGLYRTTPDGTLEDGNQALAKMLGFVDRASLLEAPVPSFYVEPADREKWMHAMEGEGTVRDYELQLRRRDGSVIWVRDSARAIRVRDEKTVGYEGALVEITRQKQAEWEARQATQQLSAWVNELERRTREMSLIKQMGDMLQSSPTAEEAYAVMAHWAEQLFEGRPGALCVIASSRNMVEPVAQWGSPALGEPVFAPKDCWALRTGRPHVVNDPRSRLVCTHLSEPLPGPSVCVPMMAQGEALGILHLQSNSAMPLRGATEGPDGAVDQVVVAVAEHLALALANLRLRESLRTQSIRDPLTGLFNRRYMEESLEREFRRAERRGHAVGVLMLDLDHFNHFNNSFGHQAGDDLLEAFGEMLRTHVRVEDIACRYGGEEFVLILPEATLETAHERAELLRQEVRELRVNSRGQSLGAVTVSLGVAAYPEHGRTVEAVLHAADLALYEAKNLGRDRTVVVGTAVDPATR